MLLIFTVQSYGNNSSHSMNQMLNNSIEKLIYINKKAGLNQWQIGLRK